MSDRHEKHDRMSLTGIVVGMALRTGLPDQPSIQMLQLAGCKQVRRLAASLERRFQGFMTRILRADL